MGVATRLRARARERRIAQLEHELAVADARISHIDAAKTLEELRLATSPPPRSRRLPRAAIPAAAVAVLAAAAIAIPLAIGHSSSGGAAGTPTPAQAGAAGQGIADWSLANKNGVSIMLPAGWANLSEDERGWTYAVIADNRVRARVEVTPDLRTDDPAVLANRARRIAGRRAGYHEIRFERETVNGEDAVRFDYLMREGATRLRTDSLFFIDSHGRGIGFFEQVPAGGYGAWRDVFQRMRNSLTITPETMDLPVRPPASNG